MLFVYLLECHWSCVIIDYTNKRVIVADSCIEAMKTKTFVKKMSFGMLDAAVHRSKYPRQREEIVLSIEEFYGDDNIGSLMRKLRWFEQERSGRPVDYKLDILDSTRVFKQEKEDRHNCAFFAIATGILYQKKRDSNCEDMQHVFLKMRHVDQSTLVRPFVGKHLINANPKIQSSQS